MADESDNTYVIRSSPVQQAGGGSSMTLTVGHGADNTDSGVERRRPALHPRRSWASPEPFVRRSTPHNSSSLLAVPWRSAAGGYQHLTIAIDVIAAGAAVTLAAALGTGSFGS